jgi:hypothetical protein
MIATGVAIRSVFRRLLDLKRGEVSGWKPLEGEGLRQSQIGETAILGQKLMGDT